MTEHESARPDATVPDETRLWTKHEVAAYLNLDVRSVERMPIPRIHLPGTGRKPIVRFDPAQVREWINAKRTRPLSHRKAAV